MERLNKYTGNESRLHSEIMAPLVQLEDDVLDACKMKGSIGIEVMNFSGVSSLAIESLITSCTSYDQTLGIINNSSRGSFIKRIAGINKVHFVELFSQENQIPEIKNIERFLAANKPVSSVILPLIRLDGLEKQLLQLSDVLSYYNINLLIDYYGKLEGLSFRFMKYNIMCLALTPSDFKFGLIPSSVLLAQRRFLVKCEGNSKTYSLDLYSAWQKKLWGDSNLVV